METWYPPAKRLPITTQEFWKPRPRTLISICDHITDGYDSRGDLQNSNNGASVNFLVRDEPGGTVVYQFMPVEWAAYGNGIWSDNNPFMPDWIKALLPACRAGTDNINYYTVSIEHERKYPFTTPPSASMMTASVALQKWLADTFPTIKRDRDHIIGHYQIDHIRRANCPGGPGGALYPFDAVVAALSGPPINQPLIIPPSMHPVNNAFKDYYLSRPDALQLWGLPITDEQQEKLSDGNTYTVQYFERARFEWHPPNVLLGLVGAELLAKE